MNLHSALSWKHVWVVIYTWSDDWHHPALMIFPSKDAALLHVRTYIEDDAYDLFENPETGEVNIPEDPEEALANYNDRTDSSCIEIRALI
jgi:protocatechuate 3,4-dioxygenase beta subunit